MNAAAYAVTVDCGNAATLAWFWSGVLERPTDPDASEQFASIGLQDAGAGPGLMSNKVPDGKTAKDRVHLNLDDHRWDGPIGALHPAQIACRSPMRTSSGGSWDLPPRVRR